MTANKRTVAGAVAIIVVAVAGLLAGCQKDAGTKPAASPGGPSATAAVDDGTTDAASRAAAHAALNKDQLGSRKGGDQPSWRALTPAQQQALQPLQSEWDGMDSLRKQKWLQLASRFAAMPPAEQQRVHERMREWASLTPEQRELARETYNRTRKIAPADKNATWESYQQLPEDQKRKLAASAAAHKAPAVVPSQANGKVVTPPGQGAASCPAGMTRNPVSATPPCVGTPSPAPSTNPNNQPGTPANPGQQQDKQVPANWGITPNDA